MMGYCQLDPLEQISVKSQSYIFIQENAFQNVVCEMATILSRSQSVNFQLIIKNYTYLFNTVPQPKCFRPSKHTMLTIKFRSVSAIVSLSICTVKRYVFFLQKLINGLLPERIMTYHTQGGVAFTSGQYQWKYIRYQSPTRGPKAMASYCDITLSQVCFFRQCECSFLWKLRSHWLKGLRQRQIAVVRQEPGPWLNQQW